MNISVDNFPTNSVSNYSGYRDQIQNGDLLLCSGSSRFSRMIQRATGSIWSHVGFVMRLDTIDRVMVLESVESQGVRTVPLRKYLEDYDNEGNSYPGGLVIARHAGLATATVKAASGSNLASLPLICSAIPTTGTSLLRSPGASW